MATGIIWRNVAVYILLGVAVGLAIFYFFNIWHFKEAVTQLVGSWNLSLPKIDLNGIFQWIQANPLATTAFGFLGTTAVGYVIKNWQTNKLLDVQTNALAEAQAKISTVEQTAKAKVSDLETQLSTYANDNTAVELQKSLLDLSSEKDLLVARLDESQKTVKSLQEQLDARPVIKITEHT